MSTKRRARLYIRIEPLDELVAAAGLTQGDFARSIGISPVTYSRMHRPDHPVRTSTLKKLALGASRLQPLAGIDGLTEESPGGKEQPPAIDGGTSGVYSTRSS